jgi:hypothetical protein
MAGCSACRLKSSHGVPPSRARPMQAGRRCGRRMARGAEAAQRNPSAAAIFRCKVTLNARVPPHPAPHGPLPRPAAPPGAAARLPGIDLQLSSLRSPTSARSVGVHMAVPRQETPATPPERPGSARKSAHIAPSQTGSKSEAVCVAMTSVICCSCCSSRSGSRGRSSSTSDMALFYWPKAEEARTLLTRPCSGEGLHEAGAGATASPRAGSPAARSSAGPPLRPARAS